MTGRGVALVMAAALVAAVAARGARAQPRAPGEPGMASEQTSRSGDRPDTASASANAAATGTAGVGTAARIKDPKLARKWLTAAQQLMQKASYLAARHRLDDARPQFENAVAAYQRAIEASDDPNLYLDLANAEDKLGKLGDAVKHLRRVTAAKAGARPDVVKKATERLDELLGKVGLVTLTVTPPGASITLGGAELGTAPLPEPLVLVPGTYTLSFQAEGFQPREAEINVEPGTEAERAIELEPVPVMFAPVAPVPGEPAPAVDRPERPTLPLHLGAGLAGAATASAMVFGVLALREHATFTAPATSKPDREDARTRGKRFALISDVSLGAAALAAGFTAYWYFYRYRPSKSEDRHAGPIEPKLDVVPWVQPQSGGAAIAGWF